MAQLISVVTGINLDHELMIVYFSPAFYTLFHIKQQKVLHPTLFSSSIMVTCTIGVDRIYELPVR
jgi:hypothetical protein